MAPILRPVGEDVQGHVQGHVRGNGLPNGPEVQHSSRVESQFRWGRIGPRRWTTWDAAKILLNFVRWQNL